jgi:hypothetical protein
MPTEKVSDEKAKQLLYSHVDGPQNCTLYTGHIKLMKVKPRLIAYDLDFCK